MRPLSLLICLFVLGLAVAGCGGGSNDSAETIPAPPALTTPGSATLPAIPDTVPTTPTTTVPSSSGGTGSGTPSNGGTGSGGGTVTPQAPSTTPSGGAPSPSGGSPSGGTGGGSTTPSSGGAAPGKFNQFCQENPGAC
jgi:hypothetical protein